jgi:hypothetical protein
MMATLITPDGTVTEVHPVHGPEFTLEEMRHFVGGYIEAVYFDDGRVMFVNEEGKISDPPLDFNAAANVLAHEHSGIAFDDAIVGTVIVTEPGEVS